MSTDEFRAEAAACLGQDKPAGELVDCVARYFPNAEVFRENDDLFVKGGGRFLIVRRAAPDLFRVSLSVAAPSTNLVDYGGGRETTLNELIDQIATLSD
jgi:hypothetical protein